MSKKFVRTAVSGNRLTFSFCPECGATVHYVVEGQDELIAIPIGAFGDPSFPGPRTSVWESRMHPWVTIPSTEHKP